MYHKGIRDGVEIETGVSVFCTEGVKKKQRLIHVVSVENQKGVKMLYHKEQKGAVAVQRMVLLQERNRVMAILVMIDNARIITKIEEMYQNQEKTFLQNLNPYLLQICKSILSMLTGFV